MEEGKKCCASIFTLDYISNLTVRVDAPDGVWVDRVGSAVKNESCREEKQKSVMSPLIITPRQAQQRSASLTVLVDEHPDGDAAHVEAIQEVLDILVGYRVLGEGLFVLNDALGHGGHDVVVSVSDGYQGVNKPVEERPPAVINKIIPCSPTN